MEYRLNEGDTILFENGELELRTMKYTDGMLFDVSKHSSNNCGVCQEKYCSKFPPCKNCGMSLTWLKGRLVHLLDFDTTKCKDPDSVVPVDELSLLAKAKRRAKSDG